MTQCLIRILRCEIVSFDTKHDFRSEMTMESTFWVLAVVGIFLAHTEDVTGLLPPPPCRISCSRTSFLWLLQALEDRNHFGCVWFVRKNATFLFPGFCPLPWVSELFQLGSLSEWFQYPVRVPVLCLFEFLCPGCTV